MNIYPPGSRIGRYEIVSLPMQGGMGVVYFALDHWNNGKPVALKTFKPEFLPDREARDRFLRERTAWVNLGSHPHIVRCYAVEYIDPIAFLSLELIAKEQGLEDASLRSWLIPGYPLPLEQALLFALQIVRGLAYANSKVAGFVHRDLKPENILVGADKLPGTNINRLRVTDFGLAMTLKDEGRKLKEEEGEETIGRTHLTRGILGTPLYMAPEQWKGEDVGVYTDVYALGCILYEMLTGRRVVDGRSIGDLESAHCAGRLDAMPASMPREVSAVLGRCLSLNPGERYQGWGEVTQELEQVYIGLAGRAVPAEMSTIQASRNERMQDGWSYNALGVAYRDMGKVEVAKGYFDVLLSIAREIGDRRGESSALGNLGSAYTDLGEVRRAIGYYEQQLEITRDIRDRLGEGNALGGLGNAYANLGEVRRAIGFYEQDLVIAREIGDRRGEGTVLGNLGSAYANLGEVRRAIGYWEQSLAILREIGDIDGVAMFSFYMALLYAKQGETSRALSLAQEAERIWYQIGSPNAQRAQQLIIQLGNKQNPGLLGRLFGKK